MSVVYVPRSKWYAGVPTSNAGNPRPLLRLPVPNITRHYTGAPPKLSARLWSAQDFMPWFQTVALASGKSYEYNFVIPPRLDGSSQVWEYAGAYQAAHSAGENDIAIGVLFAIGVTNHPSYANYDPTKPVEWEPITDEMIEAYRWLRDVHLAGLGAVLPSVKEIEHRNMPGAATACPGVPTIAADARLDAPYVPPVEEPVTRYFKTSPESLTIWATGDDVVAARLEQHQCNARGVNPATVPVLPAEEAAKFVYIGGLPNLSVR